LIDPRHDPATLVHDLHRRRTNEPTAGVPADPDRLSDHIRRRNRSSTAHSGHDYTIGIQKSGRRKLCCRREAHRCRSAHQTQQAEMAGDWLAALSNIYRARAGRPITVRRPRRSRPESGTSIRLHADQTGRDEQAEVGVTHASLGLDGMTGEHDDQHVVSVDDA
jgi:hypothetical protein